MTITAATASPLRHRADIDGLRALAIVPILLLHCGIEKLRGGFVGVDIFFVISGYLITAIITRGIADGSFSLLSFYRHRIVRILPALLFMLVIVVIAGCVVLLPNQLRDLGRSVAATSVFASNFYFYATSDYFAAASATKPLIHTWSLAVEEQFYLLYPLLLMALHRLSRRRRAAVIGGIAVLSFAIGAWLAGHDPSAGFFLLPARIWELSLGALVALGACPRIASARLRSMLCLGALGVIAASCVAISSGWPFPVPFAAPPAFAAALLIAYGETGVTARLLSLAPVRGVGLISYSLYLWHRPIITFYELAHGSSVTPSDIIILLAASLGAATISYLLVERPAITRWRSGSGLRPHLAALLILTGGAAVGLLVSARADMIRPLPPRLLKVAGYLGHDATEAGRRQFSTDRCFTLPTGKPFDRDCLSLSRDRRNIVLMGDSHAAHLSQALREFLPEVHIVQATAAGCRPLLNGRGLSACRGVMDRAFRELDFTRVDTVILSGRWLAFEESRLLETIGFLQQRGVRVVVIGPVVEYDVDLPTLIVRGQLAGDPELADRFRLADRIALDRHMQPLVAATGATYFSAVQFECPGGKCALTTRDGIPLHFDHSHLTPAGARALIAALLATHALDPLLRGDRVQAGASAVAAF
ncbi:acyltransferase family protein [soil metagenome]